jgi:hypothetical protein
MDIAVYEGCRAWGKRFKQGDAGRCVSGSVSVSLRATCGCRDANDGESKSHGRVNGAV